MGIIKALKCYQNLYQVVRCTCPGAIYMFEIVTKRTISLRAQHQMPSERYRTVVPLVSHYKSLETISCHSNQSSYPIGTKHKIIRSLCLYGVAALRELWQESALWLQRRCRLKMLTMDGLTDDGCLAIL